MNAADTITAVRRAIELLGEHDAAAARIGQALDGWLRGTDFETSLGLVPGWRSHIRLTARDRAIDALVAMHSKLDHSTLAGLIVNGIERVAAAGGVRPDGVDGYLADLVHAGALLSKRQLRRLITEARGHQSR